MRTIMFHNVIPRLLEPDPFDRMLPRMDIIRFGRAIARYREYYEIVAFPEAIERLHAGEDTSRVLTITFDDGFAGVYEIAQPILEKFGLVGTVFIMTENFDSVPVNYLMEYERLEIAFRLSSLRTLDLNELGFGILDISTIDAKIRVHQRVKQAFKQQVESVQKISRNQLIAALDVSEDMIIDYAESFSLRYRKLSSAQVRQLLSDGWMIGGHTCNHVKLKGLDETTLSKEVKTNAQDLAAAFGLRQIPFAYPYGGVEDYDQHTQQAVKAAGFSVAFTTVPGDNTRTTDLFALHRFNSKYL